MNNLVSWLVHIFEFQKSIVDNECIIFKKIYTNVITIMLMYCQFLIDKFEFTLFTTII
jgi:hypothetical protein